MQLMPLCLKKRIVFAVLLCAVVMSADAWAAYGGGVIGVWITEGRDARIKIFECGNNKYCGKIVWMDEPDYRAGDKEGSPGKPKLDIHNPDPELRDHTILGLEIMRDFTFAGENRWTGGKVYDPETGKTYSASMELVSRNKLHLRGYILIPLLGRNSTWTRAEDK